MISVLEGCTDDFRLAEVLIENEPVDYQHQTKVIQRLISTSLTEIGARGTTLLARLIASSIQMARFDLAISLWKKNKIHAV